MGFETRKKTMIVDSKGLSKAPTWGILTIYKPESAFSSKDRRQDLHLHSYLK